MHQWDVLVADFKTFEDRKQPWQLHLDRLYRDWQIFAFV